MRQRPEMLSRKLPVLAALCAALAFIGLMGATAAVYLAVDALGAVLMAAFLLAGVAFAASGWIYHWRSRGVAPRVAAAPAPSPAPPPNPDPAGLRLLEAVAAEVKSSASTIKGFAEVAGAAPEFDNARTLGYLRSAAAEFSVFAAQLHDFVRFERGRLRLADRQADAAELVETALALCRDKAEAADAVIVAKLPEGVELTCDAERLRQAIGSLVMWAAANAASGSLIDVALLKPAEGGLAVEIRSTLGKALDALEGERLFEPQPAVNGLRAFALPIARRVALLHSGDVTAACANGCATARLTLPAQRVAWPSAGSSSARAA